MHDILSRRTFLKTALGGAAVLSFGGSRDLFAQTKSGQKITVGSGENVYELAAGWGKLPEGWVFKQVAGVAVDSKDRVYVFNRSEHSVIVFDRDGKFLTTWGTIGNGPDQFTTAHSAYIDKADNLYLVDGGMTTGNHTVRKFALDGKLLMTLGTPGVAGSDGQPFNQPTDICVAPSGEIYVSDGYKNFRVHKFSPTGKRLLSWGEKGSGPGQFDLPHGVWVHKGGRVFVADRVNNRIQIFDPNGKYLSEWPGFSLPCHVCIDADDTVYVAELDHRVSILDINGTLLARWGGGKDHPSKEPGLFTGPHTAWVDRHRDLYIGEVLDGQRIQKFVRRTTS